MFQEILKQIARHVEGVLGCLLLDDESVAIAELYPTGQQQLVNDAAIELSNLVGSINKREAFDTAGSVKELTVKTDRITLLSRTISGEYVLLVALSADSDARRAENMLRLLDSWIAREL